MRADTADGPVICGIDQAAFPDRRLPALHAELTVDYHPTGCAPAPVSQALPRWVMIALGGGGAALMVLWLRAGR
ncbi:hypothetical protein GA0074692_1193 [Micromonospora pallida]|uniref:Uncharacterized protein n=1 Tax=Micromonospora pallida TaxID=145854 RepID=A0A1C6RW96_9ACTN|nr:hypothetical protein [Micromonospora pallida]SCL21511.1 hypothetical protein GA0074692_1193 [Micromonospora pallida]